MDAAIPSGDEGEADQGPWDWSTEVEAGRWWLDRLGPLGPEGLGGIVPAGFDAVTRVFHPVEHDDGTTGTWADLARSNGRAVHPEMQLHAIATPAGQPVVARPTTPGPAEARDGELPDPPRSALLDLLAGHTSTPDRCWFGLWEGYGQLHRGGSTMLVSPEPGRLGRWRRRRQPAPGLAPPAVLDGPRVRAPNRDYLLLRGPLGAAGPITGAVRQCPNLWWPEDRAWFLITEIDFMWTYVAGSAALADAIEATPGIEAMRSGLDHGRTVEADRHNR